MWRITVRTDASVDMLRQEFPDVHLIILKENLGFAEGYNLALQQVSAEYVMPLNSDVEVTEHWLVPLVSYMDAHPEVAACQPKIRSWRQKELFEYAGSGRRIYRPLRVIPFAGGG